MRTITALAVLFLVVIAPEARCQAVRGAFAVLHKPPTAADLDSLRVHGLNLVILQYTRGSGRFVDDSAVHAFIDSAEAAGIDYMIGLHYPHTWESEWLRGREIAQYVRSSLRLIQRFESRTGPRFRGWYLPLEFGNHRTRHYRRLRDAFAQLSSVSAPLAISIYFNPDAGYLDPEPFAAAVDSVIGPFDVVLLQDGVGERGITNYPADLEPYYAALQRVVTPRGRQLWAVVEGFKCNAPAPGRQCPDRDPRPPAAAGRLSSQVAAVRPFTQGIVAYNLGEVLHPSGPDTEKRRIYCEYVRAVTGQPCTPGP